MFQWTPSWAVAACVSLVSSADAVFPVKPSPNGRYLLDQNKRPFLIHGDTAWSLIVELKRNDADFYLEDGRNRGFNGALRWR